MKRYLSRIASRVNVNSTPGFTPVRPSIPHWYAVHSPGFSNPFEEEAGPALENAAVPTTITTEEKPLINVENSSKANIPGTIVSTVTGDIENPGTIHSRVEPGNPVQRETGSPPPGKSHDKSPIKDLQDSIDFKEGIVTGKNNIPGSGKSILQEVLTPTPGVKESQLFEKGVKTDDDASTEETMGLQDIIEFSKHQMNEPAPTASKPVQQLTPDQLMAPGIANDKSKVSRVSPKESKENQTINRKNDRDVQELRPNALINLPVSPPGKRSGTGPKLVINRLQVEVVSPPKVMEKPPPPVTQTPPVNTQHNSDMSGAGFKLRFGLGQI